MIRKPAGRGLFITFEGGEGAGKSTQAARCAGYLAERGHEVVATREPGGTPTAERLREILLDATVDLDPLEQVLVLYAARHNHVTGVIRPAIERGAIVVCDRFSDSTRAYQGAAGGVDAAAIDAMEMLALGGFGPDLTLVLDAPVETGFARVRDRGGLADRFEGQENAFHRRLRQGFLDIAAAEPERCRVIDATGGPDAVWQSVRAALDAALET